MKQLLTPEQQAKFRTAHRRFLVGVSIAAGYCVGIGLVDEFVPLERFGLWVTVGLFAVIAIGIWCMHGFRCPACGQVPRARMWAFGSGEMTYSSMVALFPKECSSCGVQFTPRDGN